MAFELTYEELLQRHLGKYQHAISIRPQQLVRNLTVEVSISERTGINHVQVLPLRTSRLMTNTLQGMSSSFSSDKDGVVVQNHKEIYLHFNFEEQQSFTIGGPSKAKQLWIWTIRKIPGLWVKLRKVKHYPEEGKRVASYSVLLQRKLHGIVVHIVIRSLALS